MLDYLSELNELSELFDDLGNYSKTNAYMLQMLLERYDGVVEQLIDLNNKVFQSSLLVITEAERDMGFMMSDALSVMKKKLIFEINKFKLKVAINSDISRYGHYKMIQQINYN